MRRTPLTEPNSARHPRRRQRPRPNRRHRNWLPAVVAILGVALTAEAAAALLTSPRFRIRSVRVVGVRDLSPEEIERAAGIPVGENLFTFGAGEAARRVASIPRVRRADVDRRPPGKVVIRVTEREPAALLALESGYCLVDSTGIPYARLRKNGVRLPVLRVDPTPRLTLGQPLDNPGFLAGMKALPMIARSFPQGGVLNVDRQLNLCLNRGDFDARLGQPDGLAAKLKLLEGLLGTDPHLMEKARYVDLSAPEVPAMMLRDGKVASTADRPSIR